MNKPPSGGFLLLLGRARFELITSYLLKWGQKEVDINTFSGGFHGQSVSPILIMLLDSLLGR